MLHGNLGVSATNVEASWNLALSERCSNRHTATSEPLTITEPLLELASAAATLLSLVVVLLAESKTVSPGTERREAA